MYTHVGLKAFTKEMSCMNVPDFFNLLHLKLLASCRICEWPKCFVCDFVEIHSQILILKIWFRFICIALNDLTTGRLQMVQNAAARLLTGSRKFDRISPILTSLHWLPVKQRIEFKILVFVFKALHGLAPTYLSDLLRCHNPSRALRSGNLGVLSVRRLRLKHRGDRAFAIAGPKLWNSLLVSIRMVSSLSSFKSKLKTHFLSVGF